MKSVISNIISKLLIPEIQFADVRYTSNNKEVIYFQNKIFKAIYSEKDSQSIGIRVLVNGTWGFAGITSFTDYEIDKAIKKAIENAKTGSLFRKEKIKLTRIAPVVASYEFKPEIDPFTLDKDYKIGFLKNIALKIHDNEKIINSSVYSQFYKQYKIYANTEGTFVDSLVYNTTGQFGIYTSNGKEVMRRTFPGSHVTERAGFEAIIGYKMEDNIEKVKKEAVDLLDAPRIEEDRADLIINRSHLALTLHESVGHATEADRIFGKEISYAGKTFVKPSMLGSFQYGSPAVNVYSDSTDKRGLGYHIVDDEGFPGQKVDIIKSGILVNQQTSREIAPLLGLTPSSNMKATNGDDIPLVRMTNFCLKPGSGSLKELIESTEKGYLINFTKTWSIDDNRNNFQFTTEIGWKIKDGRIVGIVKEPTYGAITSEFWNSCDKVCGKEEWKMQGVANCGKGEPGQTMYLSHGVAPARFRNVNVNIKTT